MNEEKRQAEMLEQIRGLEPKEINTDKYSGLYVFWSFDLVNSTSFKDKYSDSWPEVFRHFYNLTQKEVKNEFPKSNIWKYIGDEILFYCKINSREELFNIPRKSLEIIRTVTNALHNSYKYSKGFLYLKGVIWVASVSYIRAHDLNKKEQHSDSQSIVQKEEKTKNIIFPFILENSPSYDFLGPDIDLGFRISKFSEKGKLVISADLAYLLYKNRVEIENMYPDYNIEQYLKIVSFENLKGIWKGRKYPIIWYYDKWHEKEDIFEYDERFTSPLVAKIFEQNFELLPISKLHKIYMDLNLTEKINELHNMINHLPTPSANNLLSSIPEEKKAEVHCAAICFTSNGKLLIAKRPDHKSLGGKWEFGCGQIRMDQSFKDCIIESYKQDFGANVEVICDNGEPIPVATYTFIKNDRAIPGILFVAKVLNPEEVEKSYLRSKHSEIKWIDIQDIDSLNENDCVKDLKLNAIKAKEIFDNHSKLYAL
ncbi:hypothetical protein ETC01_00715 [Geobacillus sp. NFOSA3]|uniref:hypothetical protein n=1 Tax=Parageobacillus toebii TaxID=153151 RepID=UPI001492F4CB|nr:hypothetical protein [Parageobacillus toebii]MED4990109.1 hypothetical protein [Parageobacillus toebii]NNU91854.1 hypothetical protein [Geobacillus sp. NFOSA3]